MYQYEATVKRVVDGDTVEVVIDLGFSVSFSVSLRLYGINAPEVKGESRPRGLAAAAYLENLIATLTKGTRKLVVRTRKDATEKYGRYLATLEADGVDLNAKMVADGHAVPYMLT